MPDSRPNIVLIMSDQHNPHVLGCAGDPYVQTPNLDAIAARGARFTSMYCPYPLCVPSRMGFMAGRYPSEVDVWDNGSPLATNVPTFAHGLGAAGYEAVLCGRMHFVGADQFHGFERRIMGDVSGSMLSSEILGPGPYRTNGQTAYAVQVSGHGRAAYAAYDVEVTRRACEFIRERPEDERPYCLVVGLILPHNPLICDRDLFDHYMGVLGDAPETPESTRARLHPAMRKWRERRWVDDISPEEARRGRAAYYGLVTELDRNIGRVLEALDEKGSDETLVLYTTDHGDMNGEHGIWWKSSFYEGSAGVPCLAAWPGVIPEGLRVDAVSNLVDLGPTVLDIVGGPSLPDANGRSLADFLRGGAPERWPDETFCEYLGLLGDKPGCMIRSGPWKLNYHSEFQTYQLFNIEDDPGELDDLRDDPDLRELADGLLTRIHGRWSAERTLERVERKNRARLYIGECGHAPLPHGIERWTPPEDANAFDFDQLPREPVVPGG